MFCACVLFFTVVRLCVLLFCGAAVDLFRSCMQNEAGSVGYAFQPTLDCCDRPRNRYHRKRMTQSSKRFQSFEDLIGRPKEITELCESESDRGAILILAAYLEEILGLLIASSCISPAAADDILEFRGPAGGFDLKTRLCFALGIIHETEKNGLEAIRKIRNAAAHFDRKRGFGVLFDSEQTKAYVENLAESQNLSLQNRDEETVRTTFFVSTRLLGTKLYMRGLELTPPLQPTTLKEKANEIRERLKDTPNGKAIAAIEQQAREGDLEPLFTIMRQMSEFLKEKFTEKIQP